MTKEAPVDPAEYQKRLDEIAEYHRANQERIFADAPPPGAETKPHKGKRST